MTDSRRRCTNVNCAPCLCLDPATALAHRLSRPLPLVDHPGRSGSDCGTRVSAFQSSTLLLQRYKCAATAIATRPQEAVRHRFGCRTARCGRRIERCDLERRFSVQSSPSRRRRDAPELANLCRRRWKSGWARRTKGAEKGLFGDRCAGAAAPLRQQPGCPQVAPLRTVACTYVPSFTCTCTCTLYCRTLGEASPRSVPQASCTTRRALLCARQCAMANASRHVHCRTCHRRKIQPTSSCSLVSSA